MEALGRVANALSVADDVYVPLRDAGGVSFLCTNAAGDTWTLTEARDAAGTGAQVLPTISTFHAQATVGAAWVKTAQAAASTVVTSASQDVAWIDVEEEELSDGYTHVKIASTSTGTVVAILRDLQVQRAPANLQALV